MQDKEVEEEYSKQCYVYHGEDSGTSAGGARVKTDFEGGGTR